MNYTKGEAKEWAREHMRGVCNSILPTFSNDLRTLNERAIRHDVRRSIELGFWGALAVSECGTTLDEYKHLLEVFIDEARGRLKCVVQGSFNTKADVIEVCQHAEAAGADAMLLGYPAGFVPHSEPEIYEWTAGVLERTTLATILYSAHAWNFGRLHPAQLSLAVVAALAELPNAVAIKCEGGEPGNGALFEMWRACKERLLIVDPREYNCPAWISAFGMQWMGTSDYEYFGDCVPRYFSLLQQGKCDDGMEIYWRIHPARLARVADAQSVAGANMIHRVSWKYQGWLNGFNGGPVRGPHMRIDDRAAERLRSALVKTRIISSDTPGDLAEFHMGRHPA